MGLGRLIYPIFLSKNMVSKKQKLHLERLNANQKGKNNRNWKGEKRRDNHGYILIYSPNHPNNKRNYVAEHRLVMEKKIGRYLVKGEQVHHINEIKNDNRIENLILMTISKHLSLHRKELWKKIKGDKKLLEKVKQNMSNGQKKEAKTRVRDKMGRWT